MNVLCVLVVLLSLVCSSFTYSVEEYRFYPLPVRRALEEQEYVKRMIPKERRAPAEFEDMTTLMRSLDGIQKPRFG